MYVLTILIQNTISLLKSFFVCFFFFVIFFFVTELSLLVDHHKPKHTLKICYCCVKGQGHSNGSIFYFLFFVTELSLLVDHHKPKHTLKICYCCVKGQGHSNGSKLNLMFVGNLMFLWTVETLVNELGTVIHHHELQSPNVLWNVCFALLKVNWHQGHSKGSECHWLFTWMIFSEQYNLL